MHSTLALLLFWMPFAETPPTLPAMGFAQLPQTEFCAQVVDQLERAQQKMLDELWSYLDWENLDAMGVPDETYGYPELPPIELPAEVQQGIDAWRLTGRVQDGNLALPKRREALAALVQLIGRARVVRGDLPSMAPPWAH